MSCLLSEYTRFRRVTVVLGRNDAHVYCIRGWGGEETILPDGRKGERVCLYLLMIIGFGNGDSHTRATLECL